MQYNMDYKKPVKQSIKREYISIK